MATSRNQALVINLLNMKRKKGKKERRKIEREGRGSRVDLPLTFTIKRSQDTVFIVTKVLQYC